MYIYNYFVTYKYKENYLQKIFQEEYFFLIVFTYFISNFPSKNFVLNFSRKILVAL